MAAQMTDGGDSSDDDEDSSDSSQMKVDMDGDEEEEDDMEQLTFGCILYQGKNQKPASEPALQRQPGQASMYLEYILVWDDVKKKYNTIRTLMDKGANLSICDAAWAESIGAQKISGKGKRVGALNGSSDIVGTYRIIFQTKTGPKHADFQAVEKASKAYPSYQLEVPESIQTQYQLTTRHLYQRRGPVPIVFGADLNELHPQEQGKEEGVTVALSEITGNLLLLGAQRLPPQTKKVDKTLIKPPSYPTLMNMVTGGKPGQPEGDDNVWVCLACNMATHGAAVKDELFWEKYGIESDVIYHPKTCKTCLDCKTCAEAAVAETEEERLQRELLNRTYSSMPRRFSGVVSTFMIRVNTIRYKVTGSKRYLRPRASTKG